MKIYLWYRLITYWTHSTAYFVLHNNGSILSSGRLLCHMETAILNPPLHWSTKTLHKEIRWAGHLLCQYQSRSLQWGFLGWRVTFFLSFLSFLVKKFNSLNRCVMYCRIFYSLEQAFLIGRKLTSIWSKRYSEVPKRVMAVLDIRLDISVKQWNQKN